MQLFESGLPSNIQNNKNSMLNNLKNIIMKATVLFRVIVLAIVALVGVNNVNAQDENFVTMKRR